MKTFVQILLYSTLLTGAVFWLFLSWIIELIFWFKQWFISYIPTELKPFIAMITFILSFMTVQMFMAK